MVNSFRDYTLVIAEKPDAAYRIALAIDNNCKSKGTKSLKYWEADRDGVKYIICPAVGHIFNIASIKGSSNIYPVFDVFWSDSGFESRVNLFRTLARNAKKFVVACDYDIEGDAIGYNIIKYACLVDPSNALRIYFSTLAPEDILSALKSPTLVGPWSIAVAGRSRHLIDFMWGVNISRALSLSLIRNSYFKLSLGRVQGPTLNYIYEREKERNLHLPTPFWKVFSRGTINDHQILLEYERNCFSKDEPNKIKEELENTCGEVGNLIRRRFAVSPPYPFNLNDLQYEAYKIFHFEPSLTLKIAEALYLKALISYPRTDSQKIPKSIGYDRILNGLSHNKDYKFYIETLTNKVPIEGSRGDSAHPAIFPTGLQPVNLDRRHHLLYDLIVRRFLATFAKRCIKETLRIEVKNHGYNFVANFNRIVYPGFTEIYNFGKHKENWLDVEVTKGSLVRFMNVYYNEEYTSPPPAYNPAALLSKMENDDIGTKTTRSEIIDVLYERRYIKGRNIQITQLGMLIIETAKLFYPELISVETTRELEKDISDIENDADRYSSIIIKCASKVLSALEKFESKKSLLTAESHERYLRLSKDRQELTKCPICGMGSLVIIRSHKSGKRFVGCTNYSKGCKASAPLPQRGLIRYSGNLCKMCGWPIIYVFYPHRRYPWRVCINMSCPRKLAKSEAK
jgi:DNA topoisomerase-1